MSESGSELEVVCGNCGEHVSPYVTECPYCGTRVRKRAPKLERTGEGIGIRPPRTDRLRVLAGRTAERAETRPWATIVLLVAPAILLVVQRAADLRPDEVGALVGPVGGELWRYVAAPFVYDDLGYLVVCLLGLSIFALPLERRLGSPSTLILLLACGVLGVLAADGAATAGLDDFLVAAGGNGIALGALGAWFAIRRAEISRSSGEDVYDAFGVLVAALVLLLIPLVEESASPIAGAVGALVGLAAGQLAVVLGAADRG